MDITQFIAECRESLLIADYNTYRTQLSRNLLATRRRLAFTTSRKENFTKQPVSLENIRSSHEFPHVLLLAAERAWAHAMHMKTTHADDANGRNITGSTRKHIISRLSKATKIAIELVSLLQALEDAHATDQDVLEARAYASCLAGSVEFEKRSRGEERRNVDVESDSWHPCLKYYSQAQVIYTALYDSGKGDVFKDFLTNTVDPTIRYAAYQARLSRTIPIITIAKRYFPKEDKKLVEMVMNIQPYALLEQTTTETSNGEHTSPTLSIPNHVSWRGRKAYIVDASIGQALATLRTAETRLSGYLASHDHVDAKDRAAAYDEVLIGSQDATDTVKRAIDELEKEKVDEGDSRMQDLRVLSLAINFELISWRVGRNRILIGDQDGLTLGSKNTKTTRRLLNTGTTKQLREELRGHKLGRLRERLALYDAIIQSVESIKELRGAMRDAAFVNELNEKIAYFRALKCLNIATSHSLIGNHVSAMALLQRADELIQNRSLFTTSDDQAIAPTKLDFSRSAVNRLHTEISRQILRSHANVEMEQQQNESYATLSGHETSASRWVQNLGSYPTPGTQVLLSNLVRYPSSLEPVPAKPLFLDVAWNYVAYPGHETNNVHTQPLDMNHEGGSGVESTEGKPSERKRGWFGFGR